MSLPSTVDIADIVISERNKIRDEEREARAHSTGLSASSLGYCYHRQALSLSGVRSPLSPQTLRTFGMGDQVERWVVSFYEQAGMLVAPPEGEHQWRLYDEGLDLVARLDMLVQWPPAGGEERVRTAVENSLRMEDGLYIVELKSANSTSMSYRYREEAPAFNHAVQVGAARLLVSLHPDQLPGPINGYRVEYVSKDHATTLPFAVGKEWEDTAAERALAMRGFRSAPLDDVPCSCEGWDVEYCIDTQVVAHDPGESITFSCCSGQGRYTKKWRTKPQRETDEKRYADAIGKLVAA